MRANPLNEAFFLKLVDDGLLVIRPDGSIFNGKTLKVYDRPGPHGHIHIAWKVSRKTKHILAHRLVYLAMIGPLDPEEHVFHDDGVKANNLPSNLVKGDNSDTVKHAYALSDGSYQAKLSERMRAFAAGRIHCGAKLNAEQVMEIKGRLALGDTRAALAKDFSIDRKAITKIARGESYKAAERLYASTLSRDEPNG